MRPHSVLTAPTSNFLRVNAQMLNLTKQKTVSSCQTLAVIMKDYYYILGITTVSTTEQVKKAYKKLALKFHPDKNDGDKYFEDKFKEIQEAYEVLSVPGKRKAYDEKLRHFKHSDFSAFKSKEEELRRREEDLKRREEELKRKAASSSNKQTDSAQDSYKESAEEKIKKKNEAEKQKIIIRLSVLQQDLKVKKQELSKVEALFNSLRSEIEFINKSIEDLNQRLSNFDPPKASSNSSENILKKFPKLTTDLKFIKGSLSKADLKIFTPLLFSFSKNGRINENVTATNRHLIDAIENGTLPVNEFRRVFQQYKDFKLTISDLEKSIKEELK